MILYEYEGKRLLSDAGILTPKGQLISSPDEKIQINSQLVLKAQVLSGKRAQVGGIVVGGEASDLLNKTINGEKVGKVLVEERIEFEKEFYVSITYDTNYRQAVLTISESGGTGIEERESKIYPIDILDPHKNLPDTIDSKVLGKLVDLFFGQDCLLLEINPLVLTKDGRWVALDAKIKLDDTALKRHQDWSAFGETARSAPGHTPTQREIDAKKIDQEDYRGTAGSAYFDLEGDIAILASGGGASITAMDELIKIGGKPANYTEYSGNPPREKVVKLTKIVLSKPNLHGLWVVGAIANFTDIYETLSGFVEGLRQAQAELGAKFNFPIVIRRGGPRDKEAFEMLRQVKDFDLHLYGEDTSITESAKIMVDLATKYKENNR